MQCCSNPAREGGAMPVPRQVGAEGAMASSPVPLRGPIDRGGASAKNLNAFAAKAPPPAPAMSQGQLSSSAAGQCFTVDRQRVLGCLQRVKAAEDALATAHASLAGICTEAGMSDDEVNLCVADGSLALPLAPTLPENGEENKAKHVMHEMSADWMRDECTDVSDLSKDVQDLTKGAAEKYGLALESVVRCYEIFQTEDPRKSGKVPATALHCLLELVCKCTIRPHEFNNMMNRAGIRRTDQLSFDDFVAAFVETPVARVAKLEQELDELAKGTQKQMEQHRLTPDERVHNIGIPMSHVKTYLRKEMREANACLQLPQAMATFIIFSMAVMLHLKVEKLHALDLAISFDVQENANFAFTGAVPFDSGRMGHKDIHDVNSIGNFWSWFQLGVIPLYWAEGWELNEVRDNTNQRCGNLSEAYIGLGFRPPWVAGIDIQGELAAHCPEGRDRVEVPDEFWGEPPTPTYLYYHSFVGGLRLQQELISIESCPADAYDPEMRRAVYSGQCVTDQKFLLAPKVYDGIYTDADLLNQQGGQTHYFLSGLPQADIRRQARDLENQAWLNPQTSKLQILAITYNAHWDVLTATFILFFVNRGGHFHKLVEPMSIWLNPYSDWWCYVTDLVWVGLVLKKFGEEGVEVFQHIRKFGVVQGVIKYMNFANAVDWLSLLYAFALIVYWVIYLDKMKLLRETLATSDYRIPGSWVDDADRIDFFNQVETIMPLMHRYRSMLALYPFVIVSRFFKAFSSQPLLALVTDTLLKASSYIFHYLVVFGSMFTIFAMSGMILFGQELVEFASFERSILTCFRILFGDWDWEAIQRVGQPQAAMWFLSFIWLVNLLMLNMLLAIIMDYYTEVKGKLGNAETVWSQTAEIFNRWRAVRAGRQVALMEVLMALDPDMIDPDSTCSVEEANDENVLLTVSTLQNKHDQIPDDQAIDILLSSYELNEIENRGSQSITDAVAGVHSVETVANQIHLSLGRLIHITEMQSSLMSMGARKTHDDHAKRIQHNSPRPVADVKKGTSRGALSPSAQV